MVHSPVLFYIIVFILLLPSHSITCRNISEHNVACASCTVYDNILQGLYYSMLCYTYVYDGTF